MPTLPIIIGVIIGFAQIRPSGSPASPMRWLKEGVDANRSANQSVQPLAFPEPKASQDGVSVQGLDNLQRIASVWLVNVEEQPFHLKCL